MSLQTFKAPSMAEALAQVKTTMGTGAVILHTRTYHQRYFLGLRRKEVVEITAGRGLNVTGDRRRGPAASAPQIQAPPPRSQLEGYLNKAIAPTTPPGRALLDSP